jgi:uncharacterized membrane protein YkgB
LNRIDRLASPLFTLAERIAAPLLRISLAVVLLWIGALKFHDASPVVGLLHASIFSGLASVTFVHILGALEIIAGVLLVIGLGLRYVGLLSLALFAGTITIFFTTPAVTGMPYLTLAGQFLVKDLVLAAASIAIVGADAARRAMPRPAGMARRHVA